MKKLLFTFFILLTYSSQNLSFGQFNKENTKEILSNYNTDDSKLVNFNIHYINDTTYKQNETIQWVRDFKFTYMDDFLVVEKILSKKNTERVYIPYRDIKLIRTNRNTVELVLRNL